MATQTTNYKLTKIALTDAPPDITVINGNWDTIDTQLKSLNDGKVSTVSGKGLSTNDYTTTEKNKLSGIASGAEVNQNAFSNVVVGSTTIAADGKTDTLTLVAGSNITLTPDATNDKVTIAATNTTYSAATTSAAGLMSASDKSKLDGIASGANKTTVDSSLSSSSTNPVQNKVINSALAGKSDTGHTHSNYENQNAFTKVTVGDTTIIADAAEDTLTLVAGDGITLTPSTAYDKITIAASSGGAKIEAVEYTAVSGASSQSVTFSFTPKVVIIGAKINNGFGTGRLAFANPYVWGAYGFSSHLHSQSTWNVHPVTVSGNTMTWTFGGNSTYGMNDVGTSGYIAVAIG